MLKNIYVTFKSVVHNRNKIYSAFLRIRPFDQGRRNHEDNRGLSFIVKLLLTPK